VLLLQGSVRASSIAEGALHETPSYVLAAKPGLCSRLVIEGFLGALSALIGAGKVALLMGRLVMLATGVSLHSSTSLRKKPAARFRRKSPEKGLLQESTHGQTGNSRAPGAS
jgi:hypothetical protein